MLESAVLTIGIVYLVATIIADLDVRAPEPANPVLDAMSSLGDLPVDFQGPIPPDVAPPAFVPISSERRDTTLRRLLASKTFVAGALILLFWICAAIFGTHFTKSPYATGENSLTGSPVHTGSGPTRSGATSSRA